MKNKKNKNVNFKFNVDALKLCLVTINPDTNMYQRLLDEANEGEGVITRFDNTLYDKEMHPIYSLQLKEKTDEHLEFNVRQTNSILLGLLTITNQRADSLNGKHYFTFDNKALYTPFTSKDSNQLPLIDYVFDYEGLRVNNLTRIELALDSSCNIIQRLDKLIRNPELKMIYNNKLVNMDDRLEGCFYAYGRTRAKRDRQPSLYFHGCHTKVKAYNKLQEILDTSDKFYIKEYDAFTANKLFRLEVTLDREAWLDSIPEIDIPYNPENWLSYVIDEAGRCLIWFNAISRVLRFKNHGQELNLLQQLGLL